MADHALADAVALLSAQDLRQAQLDVSDFSFVCDGHDVFFFFFVQA